MSEQALVTEQVVHSDPISVTDAAALKVWELIKEEENHQLKLRVFVTGGGCSGLRYDFTFDEAIQADDAIINKSLVTTEDRNPVVQILVDSLSLQYLNGAEIDYTEDIDGEQFIIRNPNAKTTCGCGSSFTTE